MLEIFEHIPWPLGALTLVAIFIGLACIAVLSIRFVIDPHLLRSHHDVAAVVFANLGVLYSVLLGFTVVNVQQRFDKIKGDTQIEASYLVDLFRDAEVFEQSDRQKIRQSLVAYSHSVIKNEWPEMANGKVNTTKSASLAEVWNAYYSVKTTSHKQDQWYTVSINKLNLLMNARLSRLLGSKESLGSEMWVMLVMGAFSIVSFICFFRIDNLASHLLMAAILAGTIGFLLFLIYSLDTAFSGNLSISPEALENFIKSLD